MEQDYHEKRMRLFRELLECEFASAVSGMWHDIYDAHRRTKRGLSNNPELLEYVESTKELLRSMWGDLRVIRVQGEADRRYDAAVHAWADIEDTIIETCRNDKRYEEMFAYVTGSDWTLLRLEIQNEND